MAFEKYEKESHERVDEPIASFYRSGQSISFNTHAREFFPDTLYYVYQTDVENDLPALVPSDEDDPNAYKANMTTSNVVLSASSVMRELGYDITQWDSARRFPVEKDDEGRIVVDFSEGELD